MKEDQERNCSSTSRHMQACGLVNGEPHSRSFAHNVVALQKEEYYYYGVMSALSILQGSPAPTFFSPSVADYITHGKLEAVSEAIRDLPNGKVRSKLKELDKISDPSIFKKEASFNTQFRFKAEYSMPVVTLENKQDFIRLFICLHYLILSTLPEIEQFIKGLNINGVLDVIRRNPETSQKLLRFSVAEELSAGSLNCFIFVIPPWAVTKEMMKKQLPSTLLIILKMLKQM